ncbi:MAG: hypothetical protein GXO73_03130, partial [Calditrichaeota bacterium]|nr:hypothetical protein [Calditrichota bacterium]
MTKRVLALLAGILWYAGLQAGSGLEGELIFPLQPKHVHSSSIVQAPNGDLLVCWYHGSGERWANDVVIQGARRKAGSQKWSPVFLMADTPGLPDCNPVLFIDRQQRLWLFWVVVRANRWEQSILKYRTSRHYLSEGPPQWDWQDIIILKPGQRFADAVKADFDSLGLEEGLWAEYAPPFRRLIEEAAKDPVKRQTGWMTRTHPLTLPSGRILLPLYSDGFVVGLVAISDDGGQHWRASLPIVGAGPSQPSIVRRRDGTLVAYLRDDGPKPGRIQVSVSTDDGETWSVARDTDIPNPGSSVEVIALRDGRWLMAFNDVEDGRYSLAVALSDDEGKTWRWKRHLEFDPQRKSAFAYPSVIQGADGRVHITYSYHVPGGESIKHVTFKPD